MNGGGGGNREVWGEGGGRSCGVDGKVMLREFWGWDAEGGREGGMKGLLCGELGFYVWEEGVRGGETWVGGSA